MSNNKDGGPAFPQVTRLVEKSHQGISVRDYFAAKALNGFIANHGDRIEAAVFGCDPKHNGSPCLKLAKFSYHIADAMLAARDE